MILMADDAVHVEELGFGIGGGGELEDEDLSIDLDSLMLMLEDEDQHTDQISLVEYVTNDVLLSESEANVSSIPGTIASGNSDQEHGSCLQIMSPIQSCSGSLKDWIPLEPKYESFTVGVARNGADNVPNSIILSYDGSGVASANTYQNVDSHLYDDSYIQADQYQFVDPLPLHSTMLLPTQYNESPNGSHFFDTLNPYFSDSFDFHSMASNEDVTALGRDEDEFYSAKTEFGDRSSDYAQVGRSEIGKSDCNGQEIKDEDDKSSTPFSSSSFSHNGQVRQQSQHSTHPREKDSCVFNDMKIDMKVYKRLNEMNEGDTTRVFHRYYEDRFLGDKTPQFQTAANLPGQVSASKKMDRGEQADMPYIGINKLKDSKCQASLMTVNGSSGHASETTASNVYKVTARNNLHSPMEFQKDLKRIMFNSYGHHQVILESTQSNSDNMKSHVDDDDVCIIKEINKPPRPHPLAVPARLVSQPQQIIAPISYTGVGEMKSKINDERLIFRVAMQDLSQPRTEMDPPEGVLAVPLLRHQKIALSWMVNKETAGMTCSGGILADDQGLGKTISTISLILKERSPSLKPVHKQSEQVTLNLDDDDENPEVSGMCVKDPSSRSKGRPSAGTLVVCPTSVLRQWADELRNKVTREANLTVLVYHGGSRTKDPSELAKYDVVITTYAIVSIEVPKQPLVEQDKDEASLDMIPSEFSWSKKRKFAEASNAKPGKKRITKTSLECDAGPLGRVGWFRVVLDEAQSIKNHKTQVARACWGLRAKRRWCLSGTPIQNSIDDLYSYFRFLKYEPYAIYKSFCSSIKIPVQKRPAKGYKKLQAVLKTVMLRRTKGTILDGEPIINLPPKTIELRKVEFSEEERSYYSKLEADCRAQFAEYAAAGTVNKNYVNILLMLLFLRQACNHPYLVKKKCAFGSVWRSTVEDAKKVPVEKRISLVNFLEGGITLCGICNDVPEDAVVSVCGHIFCNQCICEHMTDDADSQCPKAACKVKLSASKVFSKEALVASMSDQPAQGNLLDSSNHELVQTNIPTDPSYCSTKLKAAIEILQSLPKCSIVSKCDSSSSQENLSNHGDGEGMKLTLTDKAVEEKSLHEVVKFMGDKDLPKCSIVSKCDSSSQVNLLNQCDGEGMKPTLTDKSVEEKALHEAVKFMGEKAIVFSQWTRMLDLLESCLKNSSIKYRRLDGTMSVLARDKAVKDFNTMPEVTVMIMSLKAASLGLNMVVACHVLMLDLWWNPTTEDQAVDRAHRIGQTRPVKVIRLTVKETVEDRILALQQKKREMVSSAFGEDEKGGNQSRLTVEDLRYLFMA